MANPLRPIMIERRALLGLRQRDAAAKAGCTPGTWVRWESPIYLPRPKTWLVIAKTLGLTLEQLQQAAGQTLSSLGGGRPAAAADTPKNKGEGGGEYHFASKDALVIDRNLANVDLHKLTQGGWHYHMGHWRTSQRNFLKAIDLLVRAAREQAELFQKLHNILLGNESGRILPMPKPEKYIPQSPQPPRAGPGKGKPRP
jgi:DNA-binding XRE family transcriptional regulator